jgi:hypothetical protein
MARKDWEYSNAATSQRGLMKCCTCGKLITGECRWREGRNGFVTQHRECSQDDLNWARLDGEKERASALPWSDCKIVFDIDNQIPLDHWWDKVNEKLPPGWELVEYDGDGTRWVAVFRVDCEICVEDGQRVVEVLKEVGAVNA